MRPEPEAEEDELAVVVEGDGAPPRAKPATTYRSRMDRGGATGEEEQLDWRGEGCHAEIREARVPR
jgi:hypothetical protein